MKKSTDKLRLSELKWNRRDFFRTTLAAGAVGLTSGCVDPDTGETAAAPGGQVGPQATPEEIERKLQDNVYTRLLGVQPHVPAHSYPTNSGGCRMPDEVIAAIEEANGYFVQMDELNLAAGRRAAEVVKAEAALITSGATGGLLLGTAACLTGNDTEKMQALPHPTWAKREVIIQKSQRYSYDHAMRAAGATLVEVENRDQLLNAIGENTAMIFGLPEHELMYEFTPDTVHMPDLIEIGKNAGVPVMIDAASLLPPAANLTLYNELGADLVTYSGGKGLQGPQSTGILSGRADLIEAARTQASPNVYIGRGMKIGKEEIIGLIAALNRYERLDHPGVRSDWKSKADYIAAQLEDIPGFEAVVVEPEEEAPYVRIGWDEQIIPISLAEARQTLGQRSERRVVWSRIRGGNRIETLSMRDGEEVLVARYLRTFFTEEVGI